MYTEHLFVFPNNWLEYQESADVNVEIAQFFYNAHFTLKYFFVEKYFESSDPKIYGPHNYLQNFIWPISLRNAGLRSIIHLQCFEMVSQKIRDHLIKER